MKRAVWMAAGAGLIALLTSVPLRAQDDEESQPDINQVYAEVRALTFARMLDLDADQLQTWSDLSTQISAQEQAFAGFEAQMLASQEPGIVAAVNQMLSGTPPPPQFWANLAAASQRYYDALANYEATVGPLLAKSVDALDDDQRTKLGLTADDFQVLAPSAAEFLMGARAVDQLIVDILAVRDMAPEDFNASLQITADQLASRLTGPEDPRFPVVSHIMAGLLVEAYQTPREVETADWETSFRWMCVDRLGIQIADLEPSSGAEGPSWKDAFVATMESQFSAPVFTELADILSQAQNEEGQQ